MLAVFKKPLLSLAVFSICVAIVAPAAFASVETTNATIQLRNAFNPAAGPPLLQIEIVSGGNGSGGIFTNQYDGASPGTGHIRTISAQLINGATDSVAYNSVLGPDAGNRNFIAITALDGSVAPAVVPGTFTATFTAGRLFLLEMANGANFERRLPSTWGFPTTTLATYALTPPDVVLPGPDGAPLTPQLASNQSVPVAGVPGDNDASLLFREDPAGNPFMVITSTQSFIYEGLYVKALQTLDITAAGSTIGPFVLGVADLAALNSIAAAASFANLGGAGTGFATNLGAGPSTNYNIGPTTTGDIYANLKADAYVVGAVPEPISLAVWGLLICATGTLLSVQNRSRRT